LCPRVLNAHRPAFAGPTFPSQNPSVVDVDGSEYLTCWSCKAADMSVLSETPEPFRLMAGHLRGVAEAYQLLLQLESAPGSMAQQESLGQKYAGFGASRPELEAGLLPLMLLGHTCDHAHALAAALEAPGAIISPLSLVRPSLESAAQAFYVLEAPAVPERVRRWLNFRLQAAVEQLRMLDENELATVPGAVREQRWIADVVSSARARGYQPNPVRKQKASLVPERWLDDRPKSQTLIKQLLDEPGSEIGRLMHQVTSAVMHGQFHGLMLMLATAEAKPSQKDVSLVPAGMTLAKTALWTAPVLLALLRTRRSAERYYGWQGAEDLTGKQDAALRFWRSCMALAPLQSYLPDLWLPGYR